MFASVLHGWSNVNDGKDKSWRDLTVVVAFAATAGLLAVYFEFSERVFDWTRRWERFEVDELSTVFLAFAIGMAWFAARRLGEARREVARRADAEQRLAAALAEQRRLAQRYVLLQEAERKSLARELHDELGQYLNAIKIDAVSMRDDAHATPESQLHAADAIAGNADHVHTVIGDLIRRLRPVGLDELGLAAALEHCVDAWRARLPSSRVRLAVDGDIDVLSEAVTLTVYRLIQEGLTNCAKHAAAAEIEIDVNRTGSLEHGDQIVVAVTDDGAGCDLTRPGKGLGLVGMRERVDALGGALSVASVPGRGFRVFAAIPLRDDAPVS